jgi:hypothetical protein
MDHAHIEEKGKEYERMLRVSKDIVPRGAAGTPRPTPRPMNVS